MRFLLSAFCANLVFIAPRVAQASTAEMGTPHSGKKAEDAPAVVEMTLLDMTESALSGIRRELDFARNVVKLETMIEGLSFPAIEVAAHVQLLSAYADLSEQILYQLGAVAKNEKSTYDFAKLTYDQLRLTTTGKAGALRDSAASSMDAAASVEGGTLDSPV